MPFDEIEGDDSYRRFADFSELPFGQKIPEVTDEEVLLMQGLGYKGFGKLIL